MAKRSSKSAGKDRIDGLSAEEFNRLAKDFPTGRDFLPALAQHGISSPIVIVSDDDLRAKRLIAWIKDRALGSQDQSASQTFLGSQLNSAGAIKSAILALRNISLFHPVQVVVITEADAVKIATAEPLLKALREPAPQTLVVISGKTPNQKTAFLRAACQFGSVLEVRSLTGDTLKRWIQQEAVRAGATGGIAGDAAELLAGMYQGELALLSQDLGKLALLADDNETITKEIVQKFVSRSGEHTSFELIVAMAQRRLPTVEALQQRLSSQGFHPLQLSGFLSKAFRVMLAHSSPIHEPLPPDIGNTWFLKNLRPAMQHFAAEDMQHAILLLKELDLQLKSSGLPPEMILALALQRITLRAFPQAHRLAL